jgi:uncharacterized protein YprB with RNaseH-like and TPR domain
MPIAPVNKLKKKEIEWLGNNYCSAHSHTYLEHYNCFLQEVAKGKKWILGKDKLPIPHNIGFFDIENFGFKADFGILLSYCIKDSESDNILGRHITKKELDTCGDEKLVRDCVRDLKKFDRIVGFYSTKHDLPFIRSRAVFHKIPFPRVRTLFHTDVYYIIKHKFKLSRNSQQTAYNILVGESHKTHWGRDHWIKALRGDQESLGYILEHNKIDVLELEQLFYAVDEFSLRTDKSI